MGNKFSRREYRQMFLSAMMDYLTAICLHLMTPVGGIQGERDGVRCLSSANSILWFFTHPKQ